MLQPHLIQRFSGLATDANPYTASIEGGMALADDCVIKSPQVLESRRGYTLVEAYSGNYQAPANAMGFYEDRTLVLTFNPGGVIGPENEEPSQWELRAAPEQQGVGWDVMPMSPGTLPLSSPGGQQGIGTQFITANKAIYFQSRYGLTKAENLLNCRPAIQPVNWTSATATSVGTRPQLYASGNWLANNTQVAYCTTIARYGANGELIESEPSERIILSNTSGVAQAAQVILNCSWMFPQDAFFRVWRTVSSAVGVDPGEEFFLVAEALPYTASATLDGYCSVLAVTTLTDLTPDGSLYVPLYCNAITGSDGAGSQNTSAPLALDMAWYANRLYLLNTTDVQRLEVRIIGTGTGGILVGDTFTLAGVQFTFVAAIDGISQHIPLVTGGTVSQNLDATARYLIGAVNNYFATINTSALQGKILARYLGTDAASTGQILFQSIVPGADNFTFATSSPNGWDKNYSVAPTSSDPNAQPAGLSWSKAYEPESFPLGNAQQIGDASQEALRAIALRDVMFIFKRDGVWSVTDDGSTLGPAVLPFDPTVKLLARRTAVTLGNSAVCLTEQGVLSISSTGKANLSYGKVEREIMALVKYVGRGAMDALAFGVAYEQDNLYILCLPESPNATCCTRQYVFCAQSEAWTCWRLPGVISGGVHPDTTALHWAMTAVSDNSNLPLFPSAIWIERKGGDANDFQDPNYLLPISSASGGTLVFSGQQPIARGDLIAFEGTGNGSQSAALIRVVSSTWSSSTNLTTVVLAYAPPSALASGFVTVQPAIQCHARFLPFHAGAPLTAKEWGDAYLAFAELAHDFIDVSWSSDVYPLDDSAAEQVSQLGTGNEDAPIEIDSFGSQPWGSVQWDRQTKNLLLRTSIPDELISSSLLTLEIDLANAVSTWQLAAIDVKMRGESDRATR